MKIKILFENKTKKKKMPSRQSIVQRWLDNKPSSYCFLVIGLKGCPYSQEADSDLLETVPKKTVWIPDRDHPAYKLCKKKMGQTTFPICFAVPSLVFQKLLSSTFLQRPSRPQGAIRLGGLSDVLALIKSSKS